MSAAFYAFVAVYASIFGFGQYTMMGAGERRKVRQAIKYVYVGLKMLVAVAISPLLVLLFTASGNLFLPVFTFLWPHLDILGEDGTLYLRRWFMTPKTRWFRPRFLHLIVRSDEGRDAHDHPGPFKTKILAGGYCENIYYPLENRPLPFGVDRTMPHRIRYAEPRDTLDNPEGHTHMIKLIEPTWTWVVGWIRGKKWGFWKLSPTDASKDVWVESEEYGVKGEEIASWEIRS